MNIANIEIIRVIAHEVVRAAQMAERPPILSNALEELDDRAKDLVATRLVSTIASGSHCVDVTVDDGSAGSPFDRATDMLDANNAKYVQTSRHLAQSLSAAQIAGPIKAGSAIFVQGTCMADGRHSRFLAIIKADSDQGLFKRIDGERITLTYVSDMLLGESQRLIKIAIFVEEFPRERDGVRTPEEFSVKVFDHLMQISGDGEAAAYFYGAFLKCRQAHNAARQTKQFYEVARSYIERLNLPAPDKVELRGDLVSYLRSNRGTLEPRTFARDVLPHAHQDGFVRTCRDSGITQAIAKDLDLLKGKLRRQSIKFSSNVTLYAAPDAFRESVKIVGTSDGWTDVKIRGSIETMP